MWRSVINFVLFQSSWWAAFFLQHQAVVPMLIIVALMLVLSDRRSLDLRLCAAALLGWGLELGAHALGLLTFNTPWMPLWLAVLWLSLILTINHSLRFINGLTLWQCFALCWLAAPSSYLGAAQFGVLHISVPWWQFYLLYGAMWAATFTLIVVINKRLIHVDKTKTQHLHDAS